MQKSDHEHGMQVFSAAGWSCDEIKVEPKQELKINQMFYYHLVNTPSQLSVRQRYQVCILTISDEPFQI